MKDRFGSSEVLYNCDCEFSANMAFFAAS